jgi:hypothetical protein
MPGRMPTIRILLDQNVPIGLRRFLADYEIVPARRMGWGEITNGDLIRAAEASGFAVLITCDRNFRYQQNLQGRQIALIELSGGGWPTIRNHLDLVLASIEAARPGGYAVVNFPRLPLRRRPHTPTAEC